MSDMLRSVITAWHSGQLEGRPGFRSTHRDRFVRWVGGNLGPDRSALFSSSGFASFFRMSNESQFGPQFCILPQIKAARLNFVCERAWL